MKQIKKNGLYKNTAVDGTLIVRVLSINNTTGGYRAMIVSSNMGWHAGQIVYFPIENRAWSYTDIYDELTKMLASE